MNTPRTENPGGVPRYAPENRYRCSPLTGCDTRGWVTAVPYNPDQYRRWQRIHARTVKLIRTNHPDLWALAQQQATIEHDATTNMEETAAA